MRLDLRLDKLHPGKGAVSHSVMEVFVLAARPWKPLQKSAL